MASLDNPRFAAGAWPRYSGVMKRAVDLAYQMQKWLWKLFQQFFPLDALPPNVSAATLRRIEERTGKRIKDGTW